MASVITCGTPGRKVVMARHCRSRHLISTSSSSPSPLARSSSSPHWVQRYSRRCCCSTTRRAIHHALGPRCDRSGQRGRTRRGPTGGTLGGGGGGGAPPAGGLGGGGAGHHQVCCCSHASRAAGPEKSTARAARSRHSG